MPVYKFRVVIEQDEDKVYIASVPALQGCYSHGVTKEIILKQLDELPPELMQEVLDFIEFLRIKRAKEGMSEQNLLLIQQENLRKIWDSEDENLYEI